jgi:hypothetical protein
MQHANVLLAVQPIGLMDGQGERPGADEEPQPDAVGPGQRQGPGSEPAPGDRPQHDPHASLQAEGVTDVGIQGALASGNRVIEADPGDARMLSGAFLSHDNAEPAQLRDALGQRMELGHPHALAPSRPIVWTTVNQLEDWPSIQIATSWSLRTQGLTLQRTDHPDDARSAVAGKASASGSGLAALHPAQLPTVPPLRLPCRSALSPGLSSRPGEMERRPACLSWPGARGHGRASPLRPAAGSHWSQETSVSS